ncbi:MAG: PilN domain-containing protein [Mariprofundaceae bacterium]
MIRINLLPYRTQLRQQQILQHLGVAIGVILIAVILVFTVDTYKTMQLTELQEDFGQVRAQNTALMKKIGKLRNLDKLRADVQGKLELVDRLQQGRFYSLVTLNEIAQVIPENVWVTSIADRNRQLSIAGLGESNKAVANFMRALDKSPVFSNISLQVIQRTNAAGIAVRSFRMTLDRVDAAKDEAEPSKGKQS